VRIGEAVCFVGSVVLCQYSMVLDRYCNNQSSVCFVVSVYTYFSTSLVYADSGYVFSCDLTLYYLLIAYISSITDLTMIREDTMMDIVD
jgi:hypothetical protein